MNIAARIEALTDPGGVCVSGGVYDAIRNRFDIDFEDLGEKELKNIGAPVRVSRVKNGHVAGKPLSGKAAPSRDLPLPDRPSIAILPFINHTGDPAHDQLAIGLRIDIQNALTKVLGLFLIAAGSAQAHAGGTAKEASAVLGVRYALDGSVRAAGTRMRVSVTLTDGIADEVVWAEHFDRDADDAFEMLDEITGHVLTSISVKLVAGEPARVWHKTLRDLRSLETFYRGVYEFFKMGRGSLSAARTQFMQISERHPEESIGPTWVATTHWYDYRRGWSDSRDASKAEAKVWAERGASLPDPDGQAHTVLSHVHLIDREFDAALTAGNGAVSNRPNCTHANGFYANVLHYCGEQEKALHHIELATRYAPLHPTLFKNIPASICRVSGNLDHAADVAGQILAASQEDVPARLALAGIAVKRGRPDEAAAIADEIKDIAPGFSAAAFAAGQPYRDAELLSRISNEFLEAGLPD